MELQQLYHALGATGGGGQEPPEHAPGDDDDVIDAEFTEG
jgi:hypothetical protein